MEKIKSYNNYKNMIKIVPTKTTNKVVFGGINNYDKIKFQVTNSQSKKNMKITNSIGFKLEESQNTNLKKNIILNENNNYNIDCDGKQNGVNIYAYTNSENLKNNKQNKNNFCPYFDSICDYSINKIKDSEEDTNSITSNKNQIHDSAQRIKTKPIHLNSLSSKKKEILHDNINTYNLEISREEDWNIQASNPYSYKGNENAKLKSVRVNTIKNLKNNGSGSIVVNKLIKSKVENRRIEKNANITNTANNKENLSYINSCNFKNKQGKKDKKNLISNSKGRQQHNSSFHNKLKTKLDPNINSNNEANKHHSSMIESELQSYLKDNKINLTNIIAHVEEYSFDFKYKEKNKKILNCNFSSFSSSKHINKDNSNDDYSSSNTSINNNNNNINENNQENNHKNNHENNHKNNESYRSIDDILKPKASEYLLDENHSQINNNIDKADNKKIYFIKSIFKSKQETLFIINRKGEIFRNINAEKFKKSLEKYSNFLEEKIWHDSKDTVYIKAYKDSPKCIIVPFEHGGCKFIKNIKKANLIWKLYKFEKMINLIKSLNQYQKYNHFPKTFQLGRKDNLWRNFKKFKRKFPNDYNYHPTAFILPEDLSEFKFFSKANPSFTWIIKPQASSRGRGIRLLTSNEDIPKECLICKYIEKPHLINNKKYDLRIYVLITSFTPLKIFLFKDGLVRFASEEYTKGNKENIFIHLTNYAVNKKNKNYDKTDDDGSGSKWTITAYEKYFSDNNIHGIFPLIWEKVKTIVIKTLITAAEDSANYAKIYAKNDNSLFELYGFDIIIDEEYNPWLLEVNVNPSLNCDSELDYNIKTNLITDIINIIGLRPFPTTTHEDHTNGHINNIEKNNLNDNLNGNKNDYNSSNVHSSGNNNSQNNSNNNILLSPSSHKSNNGKKENNSNKNLNTYNKKGVDQSNVNNRNVNPSDDAKSKGLLPNIKNNPISNISNSGNNFSGSQITISQVRLENKRNFMSEQPDYDFNYSEEIVKNHYQNFLKNYEDEYFRSQFTNFELIFPMVNNIKKFVKFFKCFDDESIVLWKWITSKKPIDKFD